MGRHFRSGNRTSRRQGAFFLLIFWCLCVPLSAQQAKPTAKPSCRWQLVDRDTGLAVRDAQVRIDFELIRAAGEFPRTEIVSHLDTKTDSQGYYIFDLDPKEHSAANVYARIRISHPGYLARHFSVNVKSVVQSMLDDSRIAEQISKLDPGVEVIGTVTNFDGTPAGKVDYVGYTVAGEPSKPAIDRTANVQGTTDEQGRFHVVLAPTGFGVICLLPSDQAPRSIGFTGIPERQRFPEIRLANGFNVSGRLLDVSGKAVENMQITAQRVSPEAPDVTAAIGKSRLPSLIVRNSKTDREGRYTFGPLPAGRYDVIIRAAFDANRPPVYNGYFAKESLDVTNDDQSIDFRAIPAVTVRVKSIDSRGNATETTAATIMGRYRGGSVFTPGVRQPDGSQLVTIPRGLEGANVMLSKDEVMAVRLTRDSMPLFVSGQFPLGTVNDDFSQIEVTRFRSTTVTIAVLDDTNKNLDGAAVVAMIKVPASTTQIPVIFQRTENGLWKSGSLLPDVPFEIQVVKPGWITKTQTLALKEGESQSITIVMKKVE